MAAVVGEMTTPASAAHRAATASSGVSLTTRSRTTWIDPTGRQPAGRGDRTGGGQDGGQIGPDGAELVAGDPVEQDRVQRRLHVGVADDVTMARHQGLLDGGLRPRIVERGGRRSGELLERDLGADLGR